MDERHKLREDQWLKIENLLPGRSDTVGVTAKDNRSFIEAVLYRYKTGIPWRDLPEHLGDWKNTHRRHSRWSKTGVWSNIFNKLSEDSDDEYAMIDSTIVRLHQHGAGAQKKEVQMKL